MGILQESNRISRCEVGHDQDQSFAMTTCAQKKKQEAEITEQMTKESSSGVQASPMDEESVTEEEQVATGQFAGDIFQEVRKKVVMKTGNGAEKRDMAMDWSERKTNPSLEPGQWRMGHYVWTGRSLMPLKKDT